MAAFVAFASGTQQGLAASAVASDTIAGYSATIRALDVRERKDIVFRIEKPEGGMIELREKSDESGVAELSYAGFHTKNIGTYKVWVSEEGAKSPKTPSTTFDVFSDSVSATLSRVQVINDSAPADGETPVKIKVKLRDRYGNPIENHYVELISSRSGDEILAQNGGATSVNGDVLFYVRSTDVGISHFTALDRNSGILPEQRAKAIFFDYEEEKSTSPFQASLFRTQALFEEGGETAEQYGNIDHFSVDVEFANGNAVVTEPGSLVIAAMDEEKRIVKNYTGTVVLEAMSGVSKLPNGGRPIDFTAQDQGVKRLDLSVTFSEAGNHTISAIEFEDGGYTDVTGEVTVDVLLECTGPGCGTDFSPIIGESVTIDRPEDNATYGSKKITLKGKGIENTELKVFLNGEEKRIINTDDSGDFFDDESFRVDRDGEHTLYVQETEMEEKSEVITFFVDTTAPELKSHEMDPSQGIAPNEMVTVTIFSEQGLDRANVKIAGSNIVADFREDDSIDGKYTATFRAPKKAGEYDVDIVLSDSYDNENKAPAIETIVIAEEEEDELGKPQNLAATPGDKSVELSWDAPEDGSVAKYRILYGTNELFLDKTAATIDGSETMQKVGNLKNDEALYFGIIALDENGMQSQMSDVVSGTPEGKDEIPAKEIEVEIPTKIDVTSDITVLPGNGEVNLQWSNPQTLAQYFDVRFGLSSGVYTERFAVMGNARAANVPDLINGVAYYFTVVPLDANGIPTGEIYGEEYAMPMFTGLHSAPVYTPVPQIQKIEKLEETGPQDIFIAFLSLSFSLAMFFFHRAFALARNEN